MSVISYISLLCGNTEDQQEMLSAVTTPVKLGRLGKSDIRKQSTRTAYNVYKFLKDISEQPANFSDINFTKKKKKKQQLKSLVYIATQCRTFVVKLSVLCQTIKCLLVPGRHIKKTSYRHELL
jgi:hypothetical protein